MYKRWFFHGTRNRRRPVGVAKCPGFRVGPAVKGDLQFVRKSPSNVMGAPPYSSQRVEGEETCQGGGGGRFIKWNGEKRGGGGWSNRMAERKPSKVARRDQVRRAAHPKKARKGARRVPGIKSSKFEAPPRAIEGQVSRPPTSVTGKDRYCGDILVANFPRAGSVAVRSGNARWMRNHLRHGRFEGDSGYTSRGRC